MYAVSNDWSLYGILAAERFQQSEFENFFLENFKTTHENKERERKSVFHNFLGAKFAQAGRWVGSLVSKE